MSVLRKRKRFMFAKCPRRVTLNLSQIEKQDQSNYRVKKKMLKKKLLKPTAKNR